MGDVESNVDMQNFTHEIRPRLRIWGRDNASVTSSLKQMVHDLGEDCSRRIEWLPEYRNSDIMSEVFNRVDAIVVPSIWVENSPLVIHEAQQARVPVITADAGGMAEYVYHEQNGLLFRHRDTNALVEQMQRFVDDPDFAESLGRRGYIKNKSGDVPSIEDHVDELIRHYRSLQREVVTAR
jgi:glycosyltransferase involved in cell wall biosynthesis